MMPGTASHCATVEGRVLLFEHVPALVCAQCGDTAVSSTVAAEIDRLIQERPAPTRVALADGYDLARLQEPARTMV